MKPRLFEPLSVGSLRLSNRIVIAPMCQYAAEDGSATDWHLIHLGNLALSGAGLMVLEATAVSPEGRISPFDLGLYSDENEARLERVIQAVRQYSPMPLAVQLAHAGRKASTRAPWEGGGQIAPDEALGWQTVGPSDQAHAASDVAPHALSRDEMARIRDDFAQAARRAARIGLDGIELHAAHGYLLHQFLSPLANQRDDLYGGSLENRMRFPLEVFEAVRAAFPADKPVWVRLSGTDWVPGGWNIEETVALSKALQARGCAAIHVSSGGVSTAQSLQPAPNYQVPLAESVKAAVDIPVIAVGLITEPQQAEDILRQGKADAIGVARTMLYNPRWPWHAAAQLGAQAWAPPQYLRSQPAGLRDLFTSERGER